MIAVCPCPSASPPSLSPSSPLPWSPQVGIPAGAGGQCADRGPVRVCARQAQCHTPGRSRPHRHRRSQGAAPLCVCFSLSDTWWDGKPPAHPLGSDLHSPLERITPLKQKSHPLSTYPCRICGTQAAELGRGRFAVVRKARRRKYVPLSSPPRHLHFFGTKHFLCLCG